mgnify:CR=1 FL=1
MKRDRRAEGEKILQGAEHTLRESLIEILPEVAFSGEHLFFNSQFNPHNLAPHLLSKRGEALLQTSLGCVEMREALGLPVAGSVGDMFLASCREASSSNPHRLGPRWLAAELLDLLSHD